MAPTLAWLAASLCLQVLARRDARGDGFVCMLRVLSVNRSLLAENFFSTAFFFEQAE